MDVLLFLARLSFAAEESPTCGDGDEITLEIDAEGVEYNWSVQEGAEDDGVEIIETDGPRITVRCPPCPSSHDGDRWDVQVQVIEANGNLTWAYAYFEQECPDADGGTTTSCASSRGGSVWLALLALAFRRRRS